MRLMLALSSVYRGFCIWIVTFSVTATAFFTVSARAETLIESCRAENFLDLSSSAQGYLDSISSLESIDWGLGSDSTKVWETARLNNANLKKHRAEWAESHSWAPLLFSIRDQLLASSGLRAFRNNDFLQLDFQAAAECGVACIQSFNFSIGIVPAQIDLLFKADPIRFQENARFLIAHEIGHYIQSYGMWVAGNFSGKDEFYKKYGEMSYRRLHLEVDAIALILSHVDRHSASQSLNSIVMMLNLEGQRTGDLPVRGQCLTSLP